MSVLIGNDGFSSEEAQSFLTSEEVALFHQQGYLIKKQCLPIDEMKKLDSELTKIIETSLSPKKFVNDESQIHIAEDLVHFKNKSIVKIEGISGISPAIRDIVKSDRMLHTFFELLGTDSIEHLISDLIPKLPHDKVEIPKKRDLKTLVLSDPYWTDTLGNGSYALCVIPVDPIRKENGGFWIDKFHYSILMGVNDRPWYKSKEKMWVETDPGDLIFIHPHFFYGTEANNSSKPARLLFMGFCAYGANHMAFPGIDVNICYRRAQAKIVGEAIHWTTEWPLMHNETKG